MAENAGGSKAKYIREILDKALEIPVPQMSPDEFLRIFGLHVTPEEIKKLTLADAMVRQLVTKAAAGNDRSIQEVLDRLLGKPMQTTESVTKSYNYHDFLLECKTLDAKESGIVEIEAPKVRQITQRAPDVLEDFL